MANYIEYQKCVAQEFKASENKVRWLIKDANWLEEGKSKETILLNYLKRIIPKHISVGTGFIRNNNEITTQIDIILYDNTYPLLFCEGDFIICTSECVLGIIEVKSQIKASEITGIINKANENERIIDMTYHRYNIFNGIFSYNIKNNISNYYKYIINSNSKIFNNKCSNMVNHIVLGDEFFIKLCDTKTNPKSIPPHYAVYKMDGDLDGLAYTYFFSELLWSIYRQSKNFIGRLPKEYGNYLFPIDEDENGNLLHKIIFK